MMNDDINGVEYWSARDLMPCFGYKRWSNFVGIIQRANGIIKHKCLDGEIIKTTIIVTTGYDAKREIVDYSLNRDAALLVKELCSSYKLNNFFSIRNETVVLQLVEKYCRKKDINFQYQHRVGRFLFDCAVGNNVLIEFDEPHHQISTKQKRIDMDKNVVAIDNGFSLYRVNLEMDIIDIIIYLESVL